MPLYLGIDTSCDDTAVAVVRDQQILSNSIASQDAVHTSWGGVVPNLARQAHQDQFASVFQRALTQAKVAPADLDGIAVTYGPGLAIALEVGIEQALALAALHSLPLFPVNHMEGHLWSALASEGGAPTLLAQAVEFPALGVLVSGGHTQLLLIHNWGVYEILGQTVDDAFGEAFDKVARLLGLGYPGGAQLAALAETGNPTTYPLPIAMLQSHDVNVSYSGIKTATLSLVRTLTQGGKRQLTTQERADVAASFERSCVETLIKKLRKILEHHPVKQIFVGGGASANRRLITRLREEAARVSATVYLPPSPQLSRDNAAMIALAACLVKRSPVTTLDRNPVALLTDPLPG